jgi:hypothetical protein
MEILKIIRLSCYNYYLGVRVPKQIDIVHLPEMHIGKRAVQDGSSNSPKNKESKDAPFQLFESA